MTLGSAATTTVWSKAVENTPRQRIPKTTHSEERREAMAVPAAFTTRRLY